MDNDLSWRNILYKYSENILTFYINGTLQTLPTPHGCLRMPDPVKPMCWKGMKAAGSHTEMTSIVLECSIK